MNKRYLKTGICALDFFGSMDPEDFKTIDTIIWDPPYFDKGNKTHEERFHPRGNRFTRDISINAVLMDPKKRLDIQKYLEIQTNATWIKFHSVDNSYSDKYKMVWYKKKPGLSGATIYPVHEFIWISPAVDKKIPRGTFPYIMEYPITGAKNQYHHNGYRTAKKPYELFLKLFRGLNSKSILDPFAGFGDSIVAADFLGLDIYACDLDSSLNWDRKQSLEDWL